MTDKEKEECTMCEGQGYIMNEDYETGDCITCEGAGFILSD